MINGLYGLFSSERKKKYINFKYAIYKSSSNYLCLENHFIVVTSNQ